MSGIGRANRTGGLRLRATVGKDGALPGVLATAGGALGQAGGALVGGGRGVLGSLGIEDAAGRAAGGIQERLPAMPGMRSRRVTGEPRLRGQGNTVAEALAMAPSAAADRQPIQERVPRVAPPSAPAPTPPASPPERVMPSKGMVFKSPMKAGTIVVKSEVVVAGAAYDTRLQAHPKVLPKEATNEKNSNGPETWDDRSHREILWGISREHTGIGFVTVFLFGSGPKLATAPQAAQLLCGSAITMLFFACAQLRYMWLGATWSDLPPDYTAGVLTADVWDRMPFLSYVSFAGALVGWIGLFFVRLLFCLANNTVSARSKREAKMIYAGTWMIVLTLVLALSVGAMSMSGNMDAPTVRADVMAAWVLALFVQWLLFEPMMLLGYLCITLMLKWCTSFEDLPEVKAEHVKKQRELVAERKAQLQAARGIPDKPTTPPLQITSTKKFSS